MRGGMGAQTNRAPAAEARLGGDVRRLRTSVGSGAQPPSRRRTSSLELGRSVFLGYTPAPRPSSSRWTRRSSGRGRACSRGTCTRCSGARTASGSRGRTGQGRRTLLTRLLEASADREEQIFFLGQEVWRRGRPIGSSIASARFPPHTRAAGHSRWSPRWGPIRTGSSPRRGPSAGEVRKLLLAEGLARRPWAVVLDEPTNHLDLPTVERLGAALARTQGALLLVTHDDALAEPAPRLAGSSKRPAC